MRRGVGRSPLITTILTTYRRPKLLRRAIMSVLKQSFSGIRLMVLDDASGDETESVVKSMAQQDARIVYIRHARNIGMTPNWRYGLEQVDTPYFSFLSDDDLHLPEFYSKAIATLESVLEADFFCGATIMFDRRGTIGRVSTDAWRQGIYRGPEGMLPMMRNAISWNGIVFRERVIERVGTLKNIHSTDFDFLVRAAHRCTFVVSNEPCAMFMEHDGRAWGHTDSMKVLAEVFPMALELLNHAGSSMNILSAAWSEMNRYCFTTGKYIVFHHIVKGDNEKAIKMAQFLSKFSIGSFGALKLLILARACHFCPLLNRLVSHRILSRRFRRGGRQVVNQKHYDKFIKYAFTLEEEVSRLGTSRDELKSGS